MSAADHLQSGLFRLAGFIIRRFSLRRVQKIAASVGRFAYRRLPIRRDVALANLRLCFPERNDSALRSILEKSYVNIATVLFEFVYFPKFTKKNLEKVVEFPDEARNLIDSALRRGKGLILMSGHYSNWELEALAVGALSSKQFVIIVHPFQNEAVDRIANRYRELLGNATVPMSNSIRISISTLRENGVIALLADQSAAKESAPSKFFGMEVPTFQGPASFALRTGAAFQFGFVVRKEDGTYRFHLQEIDYTDLKNDSIESVTELTQRHVSALEDCIRKYPEYWLWFHRRFKHLQVFQEELKKVKAG